MLVPVPIPRGRKLKAGHPSKFALGQDRPYPVPYPEMHGTAVGGVADRLSRPARAGGPGLFPALRAGREHPSRRPAPGPRTGPLLHACRVGAVGCQGRDRGNKRTRCGTDRSECTRHGRGEPVVHCAVRSGGVRARLHRPRRRTPDALDPDLERAPAAHGAVLLAVSALHGRPAAPVARRGTEMRDPADCLQPSRGRERWLRSTGFRSSMCR